MRTARTGNLKIPMNLLGIEHETSRLVGAVPQPTAPPLAPLKFLDTILVIIDQNNGHFA